MVVDPKQFDPRSFVDVHESTCIIPPNSFALARTLEYFRIPRDVLVVCVGKSTYARCGIIVNVTPLEPTWEGYLTLEISNTTPLPAKIYGREGIAQLLFFEGDEEPSIAYAGPSGQIPEPAGSNAAEDLTERLGACAIEDPPASPRRSAPSWQEWDLPPAPVSQHGRDHDPRTSSSLSPRIPSSKPSMQR